MFTFRQELVFTIKQESLFTIGKNRCSRSQEYPDLTQYTINQDISGKKYNRTFLTDARIVYTYNARDTDFTEANLVYGLFEQVDFKNSLFNEANLSYANFRKASLRRAIFINANLSHANFEDSNLSDTDFTNTKVELANFSYVNLTGSNISKIQLETLRTYKCAVLPNGDIYTNGGEYSCNTLKFPKKRVQVFKKGKVITKIIGGSQKDFETYNETGKCEDCDLSGYSICYDRNGDVPAEINYSDLRKSKFNYCALSHSKISNNIMYNMYINNTHFESTIFTFSKFDFSTIYGSSFSTSNFEQSSFVSVNINKSNFSNSNFSNAIIKGAKFHKSILIGSNLTNEQLNSAESLDCSVLPDGSLADPEEGSMSCD